MELATTQIFGILLLSLVPATLAFKLAKELYK
nr:photosystem I protein M [Phacus arnoldii]WCH63563.1 photosystem I protein M [Phacus arnoldii]